MAQFIFAITEFQNNEDKWLCLPQTGSHVLCLSLLIFLAYSHILYQRVINVPEHKSLFYSLGVSFGSQSNYIPQLSFESLSD